MEDNIIKLRKAQRNYALNNTNDLTKNLLQYINNRIQANSKEIAELAKIKKETSSFEDIKRAIEDEILEDIQYKNYGELYINNNHFIKTSLLFPVGIIAIEAFDTIEVIKYFIKAIKSRNGIAISDVRYDEYSVKFLVLEIIKEALRKFNIDENLIMIWPYEESFYEYFDKVIYTYNSEGETLKQNISKAEKIIDKRYIYIESKNLEEIAKADNHGYELLEDDNMDLVIEKINQTYNYAAVIYTENSQKAYEFINLVRSKNVFVNASLENAEEIKESTNEFYQYKNILIPMPELTQKIIEKENNSSENKEMFLIKQNDKVLDKIKRLLRKLFEKR